MCKKYTHRETPHANDLGSHLEYHSRARVDVFYFYGNLAERHTYEQEANQPLSEHSFASSSETETEPERLTSTAQLCLFFLIAPCWQIRLVFFLVFGFVLVSLCAELRAVFEFDPHRKQTHLLKAPHGPRINVHAHARV